MVTIVILIILATISVNLLFNKNGIIKQAQFAKEIQANAETREKEQLDTIEEEANKIISNVVGQKNIKEPETIDTDIKGAFIKYDVEYTDTYNEYEYTCTNGWRIENYELEADGKTLKNVRLISTGVPAMMGYYSDNTNDNYSEWVVDDTRLDNFKNNILGNNYITYNGDNEYKALQASAGFYYNLNQMSFQQGNTYEEKNKGYFKRIKNIDKMYTSGIASGEELFKAKQNVSVRMLLLTELNKGVKSGDIYSASYKFDDPTGLYLLKNISSGTTLKNNVYNNGGGYWLASPYPNTNLEKHLCYVDARCSVEGSTGYVQRN